jgi:hypothetical protein
VVVTTRPGGLFNIWVKAKLAELKFHGYIRSSNLVHLPWPPGTSFESFECYSAVGHSIELPQRLYVLGK